jgi:tight adherence protein B
MLYLVIILGGGLLFLGVYLLFAGRPSNVQERIQDYVISSQTPNREDQASTSAFGSLRRFYNSFAGAIYSERTFRRLSSANWPLTVAEYILLRVVSVIAIFSILYWGLGQLVLGAILALLVNYAFDYFINSAINKRREKFKNQLVDVLIMLSSSIRAGLSLPQAIEVVANEMAAPASDEFRRVQREVEIGLTLSQALINLSKRLHDDDLNIVVTAININVRAGGNLTKILDRITDTIRDRIRLLYETRALTSYARYTSLLLTFLPVAVAGIIYLLSPDYFDPILPPQGSIILALIPVVSVILGNLWLSSIGRSKV